VNNRAPRFGERDGGASGKQNARSPVSTPGASLIAPQPFAAEGGGSFAASLWHAHSIAGRRGR
jgi:hypothetical protein